MSEDAAHDGVPPVAITGTAVVTSLGLDLAATWRAVVAGECGVREPSALESQPREPKGLGEAPKLPADFAPELPREQRYLRWVLHAALAAAGLEGGHPAGPERAGVILGTTLHGIRAAGRWLRAREHAQVLRDFPAASTLAGAVNGLPLQGAALTVCSACASGLSALALAMDLLADGELDVVVAGGYDPASEYAYGGFDSLRLVASGPQRPFARDRAGMKLGEGYGLLVLEREAEARARGATIRGHLLACGGSSDAFHLSKPHPEGRGAARAITLALERAETSPAALGLIAAHATATPDNDTAEAAALRAAGGESIAGVPITAFKSHLGHSLGAAGAVEAVLALAALERGTVPPLANVAAADVEPADLDVVTGSPRRVAGARALVTSLGFGGANAAAVLALEDREPLPARARRHQEAVIAGIGIVLPGIVGREAFAAALATGDFAHTDGEIDPAAIKPWVRAKRLPRLSAYVKQALAAASLALADAGLDAADLGDDCGALLGSSHASTAFSWDYYARIVAEGPEAANPLLFAEGVPNAASAHLSMALQLHGPCATLYGSRCAGLDALDLAAARVRAGRAERVLVAAAEERSPVVAEAYRRLGIELPADLSAGAVCLVVESAASVRARGGRRYAELLGGARHSAGLARPAQAARAGRALLRRLAAPACWGSACEAPLRRLEAIAGVSVADPVPGLGECFSVRPLAAVVAASLTAAGDLGVLASDVFGGVSALRLNASADEAAR